MWQGNIENYGCKKKILLKWHSCEILCNVDGLNLTMNMILCGWYKQELKEADETVGFSKRETKIVLPKLRYDKFEAPLSK